MDVFRSFGFVLMAKWFGKHQPSELPTFRSFASCKHPKPFRFGYRYAAIWRCAAAFFFFDF